MVDNHERGAATNKEMTCHHNLSRKGATARLSVHSVGQKTPPPIRSAHPAGRRLAQNLEALAASSRRHRTLQTWWSARSRWARPRGEGRTLDDGYVRVFDLFRHVAEQVSKRAEQHPIFKAAGMETDFPVALAG
jgi:hypothetical protein